MWYSLTSQGNYNSEMIQKQSANRCFQIAVDVDVVIKSLNGQEEIFVMYKKQNHAVSKTLSRVPFQSPDWQCLQY